MRRLTRPGDRPTGVILAGGRSRRMGGSHKALVELHGKPMLDRVIERVGPQVEGLVLSVESASPDLARFGLPQLPDPLPGHRGPLGGLLAAARRFSGHARWLLLVPCDAPFLPRDLAVRLQLSAEQAAAEAAVVVFEAELQPTFSLWNPGLLPVLEQVAGSGRQGGLKPVLRAVGAAHCEWDAADPAASAAGGEAADPPPPFFNVNDRTDLDCARRWLDADRMRAGAC